MTNKPEYDRIKTVKEGILKEEIKMTKKEVFNTIKMANLIVDRMTGLDTASKEYQDLNESLGWTLDSLIGDYRFSLHLSKRTGHYFVRFS